MIRRLTLLGFHAVGSPPIGLLVTAFMRIRFWGPMLIAFVAAPAAASPIMSPADLRGHVALIDFEDVVTGGKLLTDVADPLIIDDVTFTSLTGQLSILDITVSGWGADGTEVSAKTLFGGGEPDSAIAIDFAKPVAQFLLGWGDPNFDGNILSAYAADGTLLETASVAVGAAGGGHAAWIGFRRQRPDISRIIVQPDQSLPSGDDFVIDNIQYAPARVPEPTTLALIAAAAGSDWIRRRRRTTDPVQ